MNPTDSDPVENPLYLAKLKVTRSPYERLFFDNYLIVIPVIYFFRGIFFYLTVKRFPDDFTDGIKIIVEISVLLFFVFSDRFLRSIAHELVVLFGDRLLTPKDGDEASDSRFLREIDLQCNAVHRFWIGGIMSAILMVYYAVSLDGLINIFNPEPYGILIFIYNQLNIIPNTIYAYFLGVSFWKIFAVSMMLRRLPQRFDIQVRFDHPDDAGGLLPIGTLALRMIYVFLIPTMISVFILVGPRLQVFSEVSLPATDRPVVLNMAAVALFVSILGSVMGLELIFRFHKVMKTQYSELIKGLHSLSGEILELRKNIIFSSTVQDSETLKQAAEKIDVLNQIYQKQKLANCWPVNRQILTGLLASQTFLFSQLIALWNIVSGILS